MLTAAIDERCRSVCPGIVSERCISPVRTIEIEEALVSGGGGACPLAVHKELAYGMEEAEELDSRNLCRVLQRLLECGELHGFGSLRNCCYKTRRWKNS